MIRKEGPFQKRLRLNQQPKVAILSAAGLFFLWNRQSSAMQISYNREVKYNE